jgi:hypothetical protein
MVPVEQTVLPTAVTGGEGYTVKLADAVELHELAPVTVTLYTPLLLGDADAMPVLCWLD